MNILTKKETQKLEYTTIQIQNYLMSLNEEMLNKYFCILHWYTHYNISCNSSKLLKEQLIKLLGNPLYYTTHRYKNMVWGFNIKDNKIIIYRDKRGFTIQCLPQTDIETIINVLYVKLIGDNKKDCCKF